MSPGRPRHPADLALPSGRWRWAQRRGPWLMLASALVSLVSVLSLTQPMPRADRLLQDSARAALAAPPSDAIVIVAIDQESLDAIGHWPWRRAQHAELLRAIAAQSPKCIGFDLLSAEPDASHPGDDAVLANAVRDSGCVVLPTALQAFGQRSPQELLPIPVLAKAAAGIGHIHLSVDGDGLARSAYLREGFAQSMRPHFAIALRDAAAARAAAGAPSTPPTDVEPADAVAPDPDDTPRAWLRRDLEAIMFTRGPAHFRTVSYVDVLRGNVDPDVFRDRYVLVGSTAPGLGDAHANSAPNRPGLMPRVEIFANMLQASLAGQHVKFAAPWQDLLFNLGPLLVALLGVLWLRPLGVMALIGAMLALLIGILGQPSINVLFAPAAGVAGLLALYPLWSHMRLSAAIRSLRRGTEELLRDVGRRPVAAQRNVGDFLDRQMDATWAAARRMQDVHRFVRDGIDHLPDPTLTLSTEGRVVLANVAAQRYWQRGTSGIHGQDAHGLLAGIRSRSNGAPMMPKGALLGELRAILGEGEDPRGRAVLLRCVPFFDAGNEHAGWMVSLVDITEMRRAQGQRDEALRFIAHDAREPSATILTIIELARERPETFADGSLLARIERQAHTGLELADGFVNLARAEAEPFRAELLELVALLQQTIDDSWARARRRQVRIVLVKALDEAQCIADRNLLMRALANVLSNALKYSPTGADLECSVQEDERHWRVAFRDHGPGIPVELQSQLFQPFHRLNHEAHPEVHGVGLGLLLVRTVVQRHGGSVEIDSAEGAGCIVTLVLPKPTSVEREALALHEA
ncbi:CHASE2 domain-containing protein [Variovorax sp. J22R24]|uniref:CHASE2 domain-containing protein n=1 Tax=Variovorax gracilis TaxID=3053502 RepID=UPI002574E303|nr:CHASE2 domain-containing protein [Variovorax sp. J22R24]MDM0106204.1 CHASE2 domain-containing protein [Variovorax sp. J22R24]